MSGQPGDPRWTALYKRQRAAIRRIWEAQDRPCIYCRQKINYGGRPGDPDSIEVEHTVPVSQDRDRALDTTLWAPCHARCNASRGNRPPPADLGEPSRRW